MKQQDVHVDSEKRGEEIRKFDEIIAELKRQKEELEEREEQWKAIEAEIPRELLERGAELSDKMVATGLRVKELKYKKFENWKKLRKNL